MTAFLRAGFLILFLIVFGTYTGLGQTVPADSSRIGYKEKGRGQSGFDLEERYNYLIRAKVEEKQLWKLGLNDFGYEVGRFQYGVYLIYERKLTASYSVLAELNPSAQPTFRYVYDPAIMASRRYNARYFDLGAQVAGRYYYNLTKRIQEGKSANNFSANYFSAQLSTNASYIPFYDSRHYFASTPALSARYGLQRRLGRYGFVDANAGLNLNETFKAIGNSSFIDRILTGEFRIGLAIGK